MCMGVCVGVGGCMCVYVCGGGEQSPVLLLRSGKDCMPLFLQIRC